MDTNWSSPHHYPGKPNTTYGPDWQDYFLVKDSLPNITFPLGRSYAGSISTKTPGFKNNSAFFWGWEKTDGSIVSTNNTDEPWGMWLAGGPGFSSIAAMLLENMGPIQANATGFFKNPYSWTQFADWFWVDAPVGVGYSTVAQGGWATDEERVAADFLGFVDNLTKVFPGLKTRPFHLAGESYAGRFVPYIMKQYFSMPKDKRPINLAKIAVSNPGLQSANEFEFLPISHVVETYPQLIGYDTEVYDYVREQTHLCGFDLNLTYPQTGGKFDTIHPKIGAIGGKLSARSVPEEAPAAPYKHRSFVSELRERASTRDAELAGADVEKRVPKGFNATLTGKVNEWFGCDLRDLVLSYAINYTYPWNANFGEFDYLELPYSINPITTWIHPHHWMNNNVTRNAIHAPHNAIWRVTFDYAWGGIPGAPDISPPPMNFMDDLAANATENNVTIIWYSGNDDALTTHWSTEIVIQNTTFGGIQGFTVKPNTSWFDDEGEYAGVVRQERGWTYVLLAHAGHQTPVENPGKTFAFVRQFLIGNSTIGLVETKEDGSVYVHEATTPSGAAVPTLLPDGVLVGQKGIYDKGTTVTWPSATIEAWDHHLSTVLEAWAAATPTSIAATTEHHTTKTSSTHHASSTKTSSTHHASSTKASSTHATKTSTKTSSTHHTTTTSTSVTASSTKA
ncbi:alpha/beta-hydrolase [Punctularia strigosozonata HHB-11173 SS5]|uniref:Carboxypeptidase n=1 Tax=Punctularia strigosozonata (strain HHB-11173) TaxID=741275 RepID=R7RZK2_PUNST|nr:alpha/beta-hydrolase [Punctularia strigosozonata HHB-11173 SS5]EIN03545.1 alpha/beta-hydrolase [Punctularia strigosozonata HHB-11173 SS5]